MSDKRLFLLFRTRGGSASIQIFYTYITPSDDIHYDNPSYAVVIQRKSCVRWQISAPQCSKLCSCERPILQDMCTSCGQGSTQLSRMLSLLPFVRENAVKAGSSFKALKLLRWTHSSNCIGDVTRLEHAFIKFNLCCIQWYRFVSVDGRVQEIESHKMTSVHLNHKNGLFYRLTAP